MDEIRETEESIIVYAQNILELNDYHELRDMPHIVKFIEIITNDDAVKRFPLHQYRYAINLICGHPVDIKNEDVITYLIGVKKAYK